MAANLELKGEVDVKVRVVIMPDGGADIEALRKTRAGGNWLTGGMVVVVVVVITVIAVYFSLALNWNRKSRISDNWYG